MAAVLACCPLSIVTGFKMDICSSWHFYTHSEACTSSLDFQCDSEARQKLEFHRVSWSTCLQASDVFPFFQPSSDHFPPYRDALVLSSHFRIIFKVSSSLSPLWWGIWLHPASTFKILQIPKPVLLHELWGIWITKICSVLFRRLGCLSLIYCL